MEDLGHVRTRRLVGARPALRDADELHPLLADARLAAWLWPGALGGPRTLAQTRALLVRDVDHWKRRGWGPWVVRDAGTRALVGRVGLARAEVGGRREVEVAWLVSADRWGEGLASEMAAEAVRAAFDVLGLPSVVAFTLVDNAASRRVMEKLGFAAEAGVEHAGLPHVLYRLSRPAARRSA